MRPAAPGILRAVTLADSAATIRAHLDGWDEVAPTVELDLYGTADPDAIAGEVDRFVRRNLGVGVAGHLFYVSSVKPAIGPVSDRHTPSTTARRTRARPGVDTAPATCHRRKMPAGPRHLLAGLLVAACGSGPGGDDTGASGGTSSTGDAVTGEAPTTGAPWEEAPDCEGLQLPGDPADLAATPRPDRDAEVLALSVDPSVVVAAQAHYEVVRADLEAIRAIDPPLADVHVTPWYFDAIELWFLNGGRPALNSIWGVAYRAWDCLNEHYGGSYPQPIDGFGFLLRLDGVYGEAVRDAYAALPGLEEADVACSSMCRVMVCESAGTIELMATIGPGGELVTREYRFESEDGVVRQYHVVEGEAPVLVG